MMLLRDGLRGPGGLLRHVGHALRREGAVPADEVRVPEQPREERGPTPPEPILCVLVKAAGEKHRLEMGYKCFLVGAHALLLPNGASHTFFSRLPSHSFYRGLRGLGGLPGALGPDHGHELAGAHAQRDLSA